MRGTLLRFELRDQREERFVRFALQQQPPAFRRFEPEEARRGDPGLRREIDTVATEPVVVDDNERQRRCRERCRKSDPGHPRFHGRTLVRLTAES
jgi:hypothetical protein